MEEGPGEASSPGPSCHPANVSSRQRVIPPAAGLGKDYIPLISDRSGRALTMKLSQ